MSIAMNSVQLFQEKVLKSTGKTYVAEKEPPVIKAANKKAFQKKVAADALPLGQAKRGSLRDELIRITLKTIDEKGYQALRARALTDEAGCALGGLYTVFPDMDALIITAKLQILDQLDREMAELGSTKPDAEGATLHLLALADAYLGFATTRLRRWQTLFQHRLSEDALLPEAYFLRLTEIFKHVEKPLSFILPQSSAAARAATGRALFAAVHGIVVLGLEQRLGLTPVDAIRAQFHILVRSVAAGLILQPDLANAAR